MDSDQFDLMTARLTTARTRRRTLGLLGLLGVASAIVAEDAVAGKKKRKKHKKKKPVPPAAACTADTDCPASCTCETPDAGGAKVCTSTDGSLAAAGLCETCPSGTVTCRFTGINAFCFAACGATPE